MSNIMKIRVLLILLNFLLVGSAYAGDQQTLPFYKRHSHAIIGMGSVCSLFGLLIVIKISAHRKEEARKREILRNEMQRKKDELKNKTDELMEIIKKEGVFFSVNPSGWHDQRQKQDLALDGPIFSQLKHLYAQINRISNDQEHERCTSTLETIRKEFKDKWCLILDQAKPYTNAQDKTLTNQLWKKFIFLARYKNYLNDLASNIQKKDFEDEKKNNLNNLIEKIHTIIDVQQKMLNDFFVKHSNNVNVSMDDYMPLFAGQTSNGSFYYLPNNFNVEDAFKDFSTGNYYHRMLNKEIQKIYEILGTQPCRICFDDQPYQNMYKMNKHSSDNDLENSVFLCKDCYNTIEDHSCPWCRGTMLINEAVFDNNNTISCMHIH